MCKKLNALSHSFVIVNFRITYTNNFSCSNRVSHHLCFVYEIAEPTENCDANFRDTCEFNFIEYEYFPILSFAQILIITILIPVR